MGLFGYWNLFNGEIISMGRFLIIIIDMTESV